ncbi:hypothetical protein ACJX0J_020059, partial [Zea mays]
GRPHVGISKVSDCEYARRFGDKGDCRGQQGGVLFGFGPKDGLGTTQNWDGFGSTLSVVVKFYKWPKGGLLNLCERKCHTENWFANIKNLEKKELLKLECFSVFAMFWYIESPIKICTKMIENLQ